MLVDIIRYSSIASVLVPLFYAVRNGKFKEASSYRFITFALFISLLSDVVMTTMGKLQISNLVVGNIYAIIFFLLLVGFYKSLLPGKGAQLNLVIVIYFCFLLINSFFFQQITEYQGYSRAFGGLLLIFCSLMYFNYLIQKLPSPIIQEFGPFWINSGIAFYFGFNMLLFIFSNFVFTKMSSDVGMGFWSFHNINNIIKNVLFAVGIHHAGREARPVSRV